MTENKNSNFQHVSIFIKAKAWLGLKKESIFFIKLENAIF